MNVRVRYDIHEKTQRTALGWKFSMLVKSVYHSISTAPVSTLLSIANVSLATISPVFPATSVQTTLMRALVLFSSAGMVNENACAGESLAKRFPIGTLLILKPNAYAIRTSVCFNDAKTYLDLITTGENTANGALLANVGSITPIGTESDKLGATVSTRQSNCLLPAPFGVAFALPAWSVATRASW